MEFVGRPGDACDVLTDDRFDVDQIDDLARRERRRQGNGGGKNTGDDPSVVCPVDFDCHQFFCVVGFHGRLSSLWKMAISITVEGSSLCWWAISSMWRAESGCGAIINARLTASRAIM